MPSTLTWLDFSEAERRRTLEIVELFAQRETRDELGLGTIRDAFAEALFPGISTVQRRAAYFLIVPWTFREIERHRSGARDALDLARRAELALIDILAGTGDPDGVIGLRARKDLRQLPSMIYWQGLERWGIRAKQGSREQWARSVTNRATTDATVSDDGEVIERAASWWHANLPKPPAPWPDEASLVLRREDADYLRDQIRARCAGTLLAHLVELEPWDETSFVWQLSPSAIPAKHAGTVRHAQLFSELMNGAALLYNLMLAEAHEDEGRQDDYRRALTNWADVVALPHHQDWQLAELWDVLEELGSRHTHRTRAFVEAWASLCRTAGAQATAASEAARTLVKERELAVKRRHARLTYEAAQATWRGASGAGQLNYRWGSAQRQLLDIVRALHEAA